MVSTTAVDNFTLLAWNPAIPPSSTPAPPGTSAPPTPQAHLHSRIKESVTGHRVLLVLGTGVTMGLLHRYTPPLALTPLLSQEHQDLLNSSWNGRHQLAKRHASWDGLVSSLAQSVSWGDDQGGEESLKYLMCAVAEMGRAESTVLAGVAHPLQRRLRQEAKWDDLIREKIRMLDDFLDHSSAWAQLFQHIGNRVSSPPPAARPPLIVTTNYDDLIAKLCKLKVLCVKSQTSASPAGSSHRLALFTPTDLAAGSSHAGPPGVTISTGTPPPGPTPTTATTTSSTTTGPVAASVAPPDHLANFHKAEEFWTLYEQGLLENHECFVHHLHGWWDEPNSIVLDAADYANRVDTSPDQVLINRITSPNNLVIIAGMGAGLLDDHLGKILADAASSATPAFRRHAPSSPSSAAPSAPDDLCPTLTFWLVQKGDWRKGLSKVFKSLVARMGHQSAPPPTTSAATAPATAATATAPTTTDRLATKAAQLLSVVLVDDFDQMPQIIRAILDGNPGSFSKLTLPPAP